MGCAAFTSFNVILNNLKLHKKMKISIIGIGGIGLSCLLILKKLKYKNLFAFDTDKKKVQLAKKNGFINSFNSKLKNNYLKSAQSEIIIDCTGNENVVKKFFPLLKINGGQYILVSNTRVGSKLKLNFWDIIKGRSISGAWVKPLAEKKNFIKYKKIFFQVKEFNKFFQKTYSLDNLQKAIIDFNSGKVFRPLIKIF